MDYVYNNGEFNYVLKARRGVLVNNKILKVYSPEVNLKKIKGLGISEDMILSYLHANLKANHSVPVAYPLLVTKSDSGKKLVIKDKKGNFLLFAKPDNVLKTKIVNRIDIRLPVKLNILDKFMADDYKDLLDMDIPQVTDMLNGLMELNHRREYTEEFEDEDVPDLVTMIESLKKH